uniref:Uncharacterized protein n=1 Tax=Periophthalmus magnuspinnatus TaxID=409849 RepID=A0A3B4B343_9GOBI
MLQQILKDMYIDPDVLEALNEDQKKTLFLKMRQEQVRRWQEREDKLERDGGDAKQTKPKKANSKSVSWLLGRDGDVAVIVIGEVDELSARFICSGLEKRSPPRLISHMSSDQKQDSYGHQTCQMEVDNSLVWGVFKKHIDVQQLAVCVYGVRALSDGEGPCFSDVAPSRVTVRAASEDPLSSGNGAPPCAGRGRVAQLMKAFSTEGSAGPPQTPGQTSTRGTKPPLPTKPSHLRTTATPSVR